MLRSDRELLVLLREVDTGPLLVRPAAPVAMPATTMVPSTLEGAIVRGLLLLAAVAVWDALSGRVTQVCFLFQCLLLALFESDDCLLCRQCDVSFCTADAD